MSAKYKKRIREEEKASGIRVELSELDVLLEEVLERENLAEEESIEGKKKTEDDKRKAVDIRKTAMESLSETKKRKLGEDEAGGNKKKSRRSGSETIEYLREKSRDELRLREQEIELKKEQQALDSSQNEAVAKRQESMAEMMAQQQQQMLQLMQQQQQQNQLLAGLFGKLLSK